MSSFHGGHASILWCFENEKVLRIDIIWLDIGLHDLIHDLIKL